MKALILAAGVGSRLAPLTDRLPKSLIEVNGTPILMHQIACLHLCGITDITVVAGYLAPTLVAAVRGKYPEISVVKIKLRRSLRPAKHAVFQSVSASMAVLWKRNCG